MRQRDLTMQLVCLTLLLAPYAMADLYNFPTKSVALASSYQGGFFNTHPMTNHNLYDANGCHGVQLADGSYFLGGNAIEAEGASPTVSEGFATKMSATGGLVWAWKANVSGKDGILAVAELPNGELLAVGACFLFLSLFSFPFFVSS